MWRYCESEEEQERKKICLFWSQVQITHVIQKNLLWLFRHIIFVEWAGWRKDVKVYMLLKHAEECETEWSRARNYSSNAIIKVCCHFVTVFSLIFVYVYISI